MSRAILSCDRPVLAGSAVPSHSRSGGGAQGVIDPVGLSRPDRTGLRFEVVSPRRQDCCLKGVEVTAHSETPRPVSKNQKPVAVSVVGPVPPPRRCLGFVPPDGKPGAGGIRTIAVRRPQAKRACCECCHRGPPPPRSCQGGVVPTVACSAWRGECGQGRRGQAAPSSAAASRAGRAGARAI